MSAIKSRTTYKFWKRWLGFLEDPKTSKADILIALLYEIDRRRGYHSATNADYAGESLSFLLKKSQIERPHCANCCYRAKCYLDDSKYCLKMQEGDPIR